MDIHSVYNKYIYIYLILIFLVFWIRNISKDRICIPLCGAIPTTFICHIWLFISTVPAYTVPAICRRTAAHGSASETTPKIVPGKASTKWGDKVFLSVSPEKKLVIIIFNSCSPEMNLKKTWVATVGPWIGGLEPIGRRKTTSINSRRRPKQRILRVWLGKHRIEHVAKCTEHIDYIITNDYAILHHTFYSVPISNLILDWYIWLH